jgi:hypothetical protein
MSKKAIGKKQWAFSAGHIPLQSTGKEPDFISSDKLSVLNCTEETAEVKLTLYYPYQEKVGEYCICVPPERVLRFRINDLIDPHAPPLGVAYGGYLESNVPVVVQFSKQDTSQNKSARMGTSAYGH